jgi:hypothetical protein
VLHTKVDVNISAAMPVVQHFVLVVRSGDVVLVYTIFTSKNKCLEAEKMRFVYNIHISAVYGYLYTKATQRLPAWVL